MKRNQSSLKKTMVLTLAAISIALAAPQSSLITARAQSSSQSYATFLQTPGKNSLERLLNLIHASSDANIASISASDLGKLDSHLQDLVADRLSGLDVAQSAQSSGMHISASQAVLMDIYVNGSMDQAETELTGLGMQVVATNPAFGGVVEGYLPIDSVLAADGLTQTKALISVMGTFANTGSVTSEGDAAFHGPAARALGVNGSGIVAGVISDSMNQVSPGIAGSQTSGDLPASVTTLGDEAGGEDEGRAMAEIIYDTAPGISTMYFDTGMTGGAGKAASINALVSHGVKIIADDTLNWGEPFFQDGMVAQAVDSAVSSGTAYFVSAGNQARQSYESNFHNDGNGYGFHNFNYPGSIDDFQSVVTVPNGASILIALQWDDPWGAATNDYDLWLVNAANPNGDTLALSTSDNIASGIPFEILSWQNTRGSAVTVALAIDLYAGSGNSHLKWIGNNNFGAFTVAEYNTNSNAIGPDAASATGAMTVAAVKYNESGLNDPESYSSRGPSITRYFDASGNRLASPEVRLKPNIASTDCVSTSANYTGGYKFGHYSGYDAFCGTSAAAPSAAAIAALVWSKIPSLTVQELYAIMENPANANDCTLAGNPDADCGYGFVLADYAVQSAVLPPGAFTKTGPTDGSYAFTNPTLTWGASSDASSYEYCYDTTNNNTCDGSWTSTGASASVGLSGLTNNGTYYWQVRAVNSSGTTYADGGTWLHFIARNQRFADVPIDHQFWAYIEAMYNSGVTTGCGTGPLIFCPDSVVTRASMAVFLLRAKNGSGYTPPAGTHTFSDLPVTGKEWQEAWVNEFYLEGITTGCGTGPLIYCPENPVTRAAMAVFILRTKYGPSYTPPAASHFFSDMPVVGKEWMEPWVDEVYREGITTGCGTGPLVYCPESSVKRQAMAAFLTRAFSLPMP